MYFHFYTLCWYNNEFIYIFSCVLLFTPSLNLANGLSFYLTFLLLFFFFFCYFQLIGTHLSCMCISFAHTHTHTASASAIISCQLKVPTTTTSTSSAAVMSAALLTLSRPPHIYALCLRLCVCVCVLCAWWNRHLFKKSFIFVACAFLLFCNANCLLCFMPTFISLLAFIAIFRVFASWPVWLTLTKRDTAAAALLFAVFCQFLYSLSHTHTHTWVPMPDIN